MITPPGRSAPSWPKLHAAGAIVHARARNTATIIATFKCQVQYQTIHDWGE
jgi:hypothetical protein